MNERQFADRIGNIDGQLVEEARYRRRNRGGGLRRFLAAAAVLALMAVSFTVGALAFSREVPVEQETIELPGVGLKLVLPDSWKGRYRVVMDEDTLGCDVYVKSIYEQEGEWAEAGLLFGVYKEYDYPLSQKEIDELTPVSNWHFFSTPDATYVITYAGDVQWDPDDPKQEEVFRQMRSEIDQIRFLVDGALVY